jgi:hypothetical protein
MALRLERLRVECPGCRFVFEANCARALLSPRHRGLFHRPDVARAVSSRCPSCAGVVYFGSLVAEQGLWRRPTGRRPRLLADHTLWIPVLGTPRGFIEVPPDNASYGSWFLALAEGPEA